MVVLFGLVTLLRKTTRTENSTNWDPKRISSFDKESDYDSHDKAIEERGLPWGHDTAPAKNSSSMTVDGVSVYYICRVALFRMRDE